MLHHVSQRIAVCQGIETQIGIYDLKFKLYLYHLCIIQNFLLYL